MDRWLLGASSSRHLGARCPARYARQSLHRQRGPRMPEAGSLPAPQLGVAVASTLQWPLHTSHPSTIIPSMVHVIGLTLPTHAPTADTGALPGHSPQQYALLRDAPRTSAKRAWCSSG